MAWRQSAGTSRLHRPTSPRVREGIPGKCRDVVLARGDGGGRGPGSAASRSSRAVQLRLHLARAGVSPARRSLDTTGSLRAARRPVCPMRPAHPTGRVRKRRRRSSGVAGEGLRLWRREVVRRSVPHGQEARGMPTRDPFLRVRASSRRARGPGSISGTGMPSLRKGSRRPHHCPSEKPSAWPRAHHL